MENAALERLASGTPGREVEAGSVLSASAFPPRSFLAPSLIPSCPLPLATQGTSRRRRPLPESQRASAPQISATLTSVLRRGGSYPGLPQRAGQQQGGQRPDEQPQQHDEPQERQSLQRSLEDNQDFLEGRVFTQISLDFSASPVGRSSTRTRSATSLTELPSLKSKPASTTRPA